MYLILIHLNGKLKKGYGGKFYNVYFYHNFKKLEKIHDLSLNMKMHQTQTEEYPTTSLFLL